jgi:hypothetical protein
MTGSGGFPKNKDDFADDNRISFYEDDDKYILEDESGKEWEWVEETGKWVPSVRSS